MIWIWRRKWYYQNGYFFPGANELNRDQKGKHMSSEMPKDDRKYDGWDCTHGNGSQNVYQYTKTTTATSDSISDSVKEIIYSRKKSRAALERDRKRREKFKSEGKIPYDVDDIYQPGSQHSFNKNEGEFAASASSVEIHYYKHKSPCRIKRDKKRSKIYMQNLKSDKRMQMALYLKNLELGYIPDELYIPRGYKYKVPHTGPQSMAGEKDYYGVSHQRGRKSPVEKIDKPGNKIGTNRRKTKSDNMDSDNKLDAAGNYVGCTRKRPLTPDVRNHW